MGRLNSGREVMKQPTHQMKQPEKCQLYSMPNSKQSAGYASNSYKMLIHGHFTVTTGAFQLSIYISQVPKSSN